MNNINVLTKEVSELIAAGEVIERPASIVKELLENSIDAKASAITVEIRRGGISYIRITDNGTGMEKDDASIAFMRHATSKIKESDDLDNIITLGFRGEALASIAAVSRVELTTKTCSQALGTKIILSGLEDMQIEEAGCPTGTTIIVRDLFYNVPARLKFLKKDVSEGNSISGIIDKIALSHPEISFKLISDNKTKLHTPGNGDRLSAIHAIFGKEFAESLIPVSYDLNGIMAEGYCSKTEVSRTNRAMQHFFVNSRYVKSKTCLVALEEGYKNSVMTGRYPFCVLNIEMPPSSVDVNVHPAKIEVRFINERIVFDAIYFAVKSALASSDILTKSQASLGSSSSTKEAATINLLSTFKSEDTEQTSIEEIKPPQPAEKSSGINFYREEISPVKPTSAPVFSNQAEYKFSKENTAGNKKTEEKPSDEEFSYINPQNLVKTSNDVTVDKTTGEAISPIISEKAPVHNQEKKLPFFKVIGELFKTYLLFEVEDSFFLLDKHAAHERIIFERLKKSVLTSDRQILLKPIVTPVSNEEMQALNDNTDMLDRLGFLFDDFGQNSVIIREIPLVLSGYNATDIFLDIANKLIENRKSAASDIYENLLHSMACRAAIKAHDENSIEELKELLKQVYANDEIRHCPHGRPVAIALTRAEIEKKFGRI